MSKVAIVTGSNTGIGLETARQLLGKGFHVVLACRSEARAAAALTDLGSADCQFIRLDLASIESVVSFVKEFEAVHDRLDVLVNNAGLNTFGENANKRTADGFELAFGVNYIGHFVLTELLLPRLAVAPGARVVNLSSTMHRHANLQWSSPSTGVTDHAYDNSKIAMMMYAYDLDRRFKELGLTARAIAVNPGAVQSDIWRTFPAWLLRCMQPLMRALFLTTEQGAATSVDAATNPEYSTGQGPLYLSPYPQWPCCDGWSEYMNKFIGSRARPSARPSYDTKAIAGLMEHSVRVTKDIVPAEMRGRSKPFAGLWE